MTIRYVRDGLRIVRVQTVAALTAVEQQAAGAEAQARDLRRRARALKLGLLADYDRRQGLERHALQRERDAAPPVAPADVLRARRHAGVTQRELAEHLSLSRSSIAEAERRRRSTHPVLARWVVGVLRDAGEEVAS